MFEVLPGILEQEWDRIEEKIDLVSPFAKTIHVDLLDGKFAPNTTFFDPTPFKKYTKDIFFELHMMVEEPMQYLRPWADAGFRRFLGHVEQMSDQAAFVATAEELGDVGLVLDAPTNPDAITVPLIDLDVVLVMAVKAGFSNQKFLYEALEKITALRIENEFVPLEVDGGINPETIQKAYQAGAGRFVSTGFLFSGDAKEKYSSLFQACGQLAG